MKCYVTQAYIHVHVIELFCLILSLLFRWYGFSFTQNFFLWFAQLFVHALCIYLSQHFSKQLSIAHFTLMLIHASYL